MPDLFSNSDKKADSYTAKDIEVLEGLEPVRRRPGMYIGGTDERALHHLIAEVLDNSMDEAVAGHADWIEIEIAADDVVTIRDNGRGIPVDPHPRFPKKSALLSIQFLPFLFRERRSLKKRLVINQQKDVLYS